MLKTSLYAWRGGGAGGVACGCGTHTDAHLMSVCRSVCLALHLLAAPTVVCILPLSLSLSLPGCSFVSCFSHSLFAVVYFLSSAWFPLFKCSVLSCSLSFNSPGSITFPQSPLYTRVYVFVCVCCIINASVWKHVAQNRFIAIVCALQLIFCRSLFVLSLSLSLLLHLSLFLMAGGQVLNGMVNGTTRWPWQLPSGECKLPRLASTRTKPSNRWTAALIGTLTRKTGCIMQKSPGEQRGGEKTPFANYTSLCYIISYTVIAGESTETCIIITYFTIITFKLVLNFYFLCFFTETFECKRIIESILRIALNLN